MAHSPRGDRPDADRPNVVPDEENIVKPTPAKMIAGVLLVFLAGAALGGLGMRIHMERRIRGLVREGPPARLVPRFIDRMLRELDLPPDRRVEAERIAMELRDELNALRGKYRPELDAILNRHLDRIRERLTPEEQARMDRFRERQWKKRERRRGSPGGEPGRNGPHMGRRRTRLEVRGSRGGRIPGNSGIPSLGRDVRAAELATNGPVLHFGGNHLGPPAS
jgi:hypothetical protein